ncbi:MAG TPA: TIGR03546 family protein [Pirellulaceae bacterium]|nr:TIGR03546 family protein [Pirellulaceae bacterium]
MIGRLLRPLTSLLMAMLEEESAALLAASLTFGMLLGFIPKDNLLAVALGVMLLALRFNLTIATTSAAVFSAIAVVLDPIADALGRAVLTHPQLDHFWSTLYELPLAPWTRFHNTVVMGSLLLALALATPVYLSTRYLIVQYRPWLHEWLKQSGLEPLLHAAEGSGSRRSG